MSICVEMKCIKVNRIYLNAILIFCCFSSVSQFMALLFLYGPITGYSQSEEREQERYGENKLFNRECRD